MRKRRLGRLGHMSSVLIYGGAALADVDDAVADESIAFALESGINHFDTSDDYGDSEDHLGRWMPRVRDQVFLATKTTERSKEGAQRTVERSLQRLRVDRVDLLQLHAIPNLECLDLVTGKGGALEAAVEARDQGVTRGIGITGHGVESTATHREALKRFDFDTVLTPYSYRLWQEDRFRREFEDLAAAAREREVALMIIKYAARNLWRDDEDHRYSTWYLPLEEQRRIDAAVAFALLRDEVTGLCTIGDTGLLPKVVEAEKRAPELSMDDIEPVLSEVEQYASPFVSSPGRTTPEWLNQAVR